MADETTVARTVLVYDASGSRQGAAEFRSASDQIIADNNRVLAALSRSATAIGALENKMSAAFKAGAGVGPRLAQQGQRVASALDAADPFSARRLGNVAPDEARAVQVTAAAVAPLVSAAFAAFRDGDPNLARATRAVAMTERADTTTGRALAEVHAAAS